MVRALVISLLGLAAVISAPAAAKDKEYEGPEGGYLVYSVGAIEGAGLGFLFYYRPTAVTGKPDRRWKGEIEPRLGGAIHLKVKNPEFTGSEVGEVVVRRLPPGSYEVHNFYFGGSNLAGTTYDWSSAVPFSLPFTIRPGEATYIGTFMRGQSAGTPLQPVLGFAGFFLLADRSDRDVPIARAKLPSGTKFVVEVTDVSAFGNEMLRTSRP